MERDFLGAIGHEQLQQQQPGVVLAAESIRTAMFGLLTTMCFGDGVDADLIRAMADAQHDLVQFFPELRVFAKLPAIARLIHRQRWSKLVALRRKQEEMYLPLIHARRSRQRQSGETPAYVDTLMDLRVPDDHNKRRRPRRLTDGELVGMCSEFLGAGTETVAAALQWIMANLVKRPHMQEAVQFILVAPARRSPTWASWWPVCELRSNDSHGHGRELQIGGGASTTAMASGSKRL